jgi:hypothetical protein
MLDPKTFLRVLVRAEGILEAKIEPVGGGTLRICCGTHQVDVPNADKASNEELKAAAARFCELVKAA